MSQYIKSTQICEDLQLPTSKFVSQLQITLSQSAPTNLFCFFIWR